MVYLFVGSDPPAKDAQLKKIRLQALDQHTEQFNLDVLYARDTSLKELQEKLFYLPVKSLKRVVVVKGAEDLKEESREYLAQYVKTPPKQTILVLDIDTRQQKGAFGKNDRLESFIRRISGYAKTIRFQEDPRPDTFSLGRQINLRRPDAALKILRELTRFNDERKLAPLILGVLRANFEREVAEPLELRRRLKLLLACDLEIKTGKLKASFALEKLIVALCGLRKALH